MLTDDAEIYHTLEKSNANYFTHKHLSLRLHKPVKYVYKQCTTQLAGNHDVLTYIALPIKLCQAHMSIGRFSLRQIPRSDTLRHQQRKCYSTSIDL